MAFHLFCMDDPGKPGLRERIRARHLEYMIAHRERILFGGPLKADDGVMSVGSAFALDYETRAEVDAFLADEPYSQAGLFESVVVRRIAMMVPEKQRGFLEEELERERDRALA